MLGDFDSLAASAAGHLGWTDEQHLEWAAREARVTVTHNRVDFETVARQWWIQSRNHAGIILAVRRPSTFDLLRRVLPILVLYDQAGWNNVVLYA